MFSEVTSVRKKISCLFFTSLFLLSGNSFCQSNDTLKTYQLDNIIVTATKFNTDLKSSPNKIEIIDAELINNFNGNRLPEILNNSSSVYIKSYGATPTLKTISLNGLGAEHTLILVDGVKINSFQNGQIDLSLIPKENIERIEIVNNGMSSIYGSEAIGGTINIITNYKNPFYNDDNFNVKANVGLGSFNTSRYGLTFNKRLNNFNINVFYDYEKSDGNFEYYFNNGSTSQLKDRENAAYNLYDFGINSQLFFNNTNKINFYSTFSYQNKQVPGIETGAPPSKTNQKDKNWNNIISFEKIFSDQVIFKGNFNFQNNLQNYQIKPVTNSNYKNIVASFAPELQLKFTNFDLITGYSFAYAELKSNEVESNSRRNQHALFISTGSSALDNLKLFSSVRVDHFSDLKKNALTSKIGLNYKPFEKIDLNIRANVGNNFRAPTFNDLYWKESGNPDLKPEGSFNFETGFTSGIVFFIPIQFDFTYTHINAKNKIMWIPQRNLLWAPINIASSESNNYLINISINQKLNEQINIRFNSGLNLINSKKTNESFSGDPSKDKYLPYLPLQAVKLGLMIDYNLASLNFFYTHTGKRFSDFENIKSMKSFNILDGNISFKLKFWEIASTLKLEVNNITNADYQTISGYPMPLRNYFLTLSINY
jgi:outer membrane cobalamin receptor